MSNVNAPPSWELFHIPDGMKKISMVKDTKIPNAATFTFLKEDHTLANILRMALLRDPKVLFAGYKVPHPLEHDFVLKIQTTLDTTPIEVLRNATRALLQEIMDIKLKFENEILMYGSRQLYRTSVDIAF
ncbi:hypothetical protein CXG81DRAFT_14653 [Caulochytrium protostelioides]|uniref:DNA-directed RNA polymerase RBP11-like dimerisation domain-containing protein n=1 Tax=Caulochytrium protostelioides TaxID=1555241 RepID=A0A4P9X0H3_9FUNG|nr:hypothetical protein CXG81DRAFT_14653 [Caulochytrium protostelioides]|eukprot:RKO99334.1 hypothetical protein CXG81DRAFT_14653 [Caulochytrium protostelioides]